MKGIAVPYLIAIILGIIILAIATYIVYRSMQDGGLDCQQCKAEFVAWCSSCYLANMDKATWTGGTKLGETLYECVKKCGFWSPPENVDDQDCQGAKEPCEAMGVPLW